MDFFLDCRGENLKAAGEFDTGLEFIDWHLVAGVEKAVVTHFHKTRGQHVLQEAPHEFVDVQGHLPLAAAAGFFVGKRDLFAFDAGNAALGNRHLEHIGRRC